MIVRPSARLLPAALVAAALLSFAPFAGAQDVVILRNDNEFEGKIIEDRDDILVMLVEEPAGKVQLKYENLVEVNGIPAGRILGVRAEIQEFLARSQRRRTLTPVGQVQKQFLEPKRAATTFADRYSQQSAKESLAGEQKLYERLGLVPTFVSLWDVKREMHGDPQPALYSPDGRTLFVIVARSGKPEKEDRTDKSVTLPQFSSPIERLLLFHELQHLLQHHNFPAEVEGDGTRGGDAELALTAVREGDANLAMLDYLAEDEHVDLELLTDVGSCLQFVPHSSRGRLETLPQFLADLRSAPHEVGLAFARQARQAGGWPLVAKVYKDPPASTEQVMHPEKYLVKREAPTRFAQLNLAAAIKIPATEIWSEAWGELRTWLLLRRHLGDDEVARKAAAGWQGDRLTAIARPDTGQTILAWITTWDSEADAQEFFAAVQSMFAARFAAASGLALRKMDESTATVYRGEVSNDDGVLQQHVLAEVRGQDVVVVESPHVASVDPLRQSLAESGRSDVGGLVRVQVPQADVVPVKLSDAARSFWRGEGLTLAQAGFALENGAATAAGGKARFTVQEAWTVRPDGALTCAFAGGAAVISAETFTLPFEASSSLVGMWQEGRGWPAQSPRAARRVLKRFPAWTIPTGAADAYVAAESATDAELKTVARIYRAWLVRGTNGLLIEVKVPEEVLDAATVELEKVFASLKGG